VRRAREEWRAAQPTVGPERWVFVDETWASTAMTRAYGRCPVGQRLVMDVPHGHGKTTTFVAALRVGGLAAPTVVDGAMTGDLFVAYVEQQLVPTLRRGDVVVMDNLSAHKTPAVRAAFERCRLRYAYLPAYSPDLNPIEKAFSKLKAKLRAGAKRTVGELWRYLGEVRDAFRPEECRNYFRSCGYPDATPSREPL
jgi:transposase